MVVQERQEHLFFYFLLFLSFFLIKFLQILGWFKLLLFYPVFFFFGVCVRDGIMCWRSWLKSIIGWDQRRGENTFLKMNESDDSDAHMSNKFCAKLENENTLYTWVTMWQIPNDICNIHEFLFCFVLVFQLCLVLFCSCFSTLFSFVLVFLFVYLDITHVFNMWYL